MQRCLQFLGSCSDLFRIARIERAEAYIVHGIEEDVARISEHAIRMKVRFVAKHAAKGHRKVKFRKEELHSSWL